MRAMQGITLGTLAEAGDIAATTSAYAETYSTKFLHTITGATEILARLSAGISSRASMNARVNLSSWTYDSVPVSQSARSSLASACATVRGW